MTADAAAAIRAALEGDNDGVGNLTSLDVLAIVLDWVTAALSAVADAPPAAAFRAVVAADHALTAAPRFFSALESVIARAEPAPEVADDLRRYLQQAAELDREMAPLRARTEELKRAESRLRAQAAMKDELLAQVVELERIERLAGDVSAIRVQSTEIGERMRHLIPEVTASERELSEAAGSFITLADEVLRDLTKSTHAILMAAREQDQLLRTRIAERSRAAEEAERVKAELAQAEGDLKQARAEYDAARAETASRQLALRRYQEANRGVAQALAGQPTPADGPPAASSDPLASAVTVLNEIGERLAEVDVLLGAALSQGKD